MEKSVVLSKVKSKSIEAVTEVRLEVCDEGIIWLSLPDKRYKVVDRNIAYVGDMGFLVLEASEGASLKFMYPLKIPDDATVRDFMAYWGKGRLSEVKKEKLNSFLDFWRFTLNWIDFYIDIDFTKVTYQIYIIDRRQCGGGLTTYFDICIGDRFISEENSYQVYFDLNERLLNAYLDYYEKDDKYKWWRDIFVQFKPELDNSYK